MCFILLLSLTLAIVDPLCDWRSTIMGLVIVSPVVISLIANFNVENVYACTLQPFKVLLYAFTFTVDRNMNVLPLNGPRCHRCIKHKFSTPRMDVTASYGISVCTYKI